MKVIVFVKATPQSEAGEMPSQQLLEEMTAYNEELVKAGIMLAGEGLHPSSKGARVRFSGKDRTVIDGPFAETKELVAGFWIWQVKSLQDAIDWVKRCPNPMMVDSDIEIRPVFTMEDFGDAMTPELQEREKALYEQSAAIAAVTPSRYENGREMLIAGLDAQYTSANKDQIPAQWERFVPHMGKVPGQIGQTTYGVSWNEQPNCDFNYLCGVEVSEAAVLPELFTQLRLKPQRYAVFTHAEHYSKLPQLFESIFTHWLPNSGFKSAGAPCFERYTEEFNPETGKGGTEVWIPIQS